MLRGGGYLGDEVLVECLWLLASSALCMTKGFVARLEMLMICNQVRNAVQPSLMLDNQMGAGWVSPYQSAISIDGQPWHSH